MMMKPAPELLAELERNHFDRLQRTLFSTADGFGAQWIARTASELRGAYGGVKTTARFDQLLGAITARSTVPFELFVLGEGKFGKSTLLNALLGHELSAMGHLPKTRCFLRFKIEETSSETVEIYARLRGESHRWLRDLIGDGGPAEIGELTRHQVPAATADMALAEEQRHLREPGYEQAIYELERTVSAPRALRLGKLRVIDTQGLNQLFPDELTSASTEDRTAVEQLSRWFRGSARGKHLEWEYRRCDAAIWLAHARRPASAITKVAMDWFARYGKETLVVVSNLDAFEDPQEAERVLESLAERSGVDRSSVIPVNGKRALQAVLDGDEQLMVESGISALARRLEELYAEKGVAVRLRGQFNSLRKTQLDQERAARTLLDRVSETANAFARFHTRIDVAERAAANSVESAIEAAGTREERALLSRIARLVWNDSEGEALAKIAPSNSQDLLARDVGSALSAAAQHLSRLADELRQHKFSLPGFAADGGEAGITRSATIAGLPKPVPLPASTFSLNLRGNWIAIGEAIGNKIDSFQEWLGTEARIHDEQEMNRKAAERKAKAEEQCRTQWRTHVASVELLARRSVVEGHQVLRRALEDAQRDLEKVEGRPLRSSIEQLEVALQRAHVPNVFLEAVTDAFRQRFGSAGGARGR